jgi:protein gp37
MGDQSAIEWTEATWNPWQGCHKVSAGCKHCYMFREKKQYGQNPAVVIRSKPHTFKMPLRLKTAARVFTCSWSDFFIEEADEWRLEAWDIIAKTPHLTYQILTKRPERMLDHLPYKWAHGQEPGWPNVWLGVSVEDQATADARIPLLLQTPAAVRWVSYEPALGPVDFETIRVPLAGESYKTISALHATDALDRGTPQPRLDWIVVGGESGPGARPFDLAWARQTIAQGRASGVPVFAKQFGRWILGDDNGFTVNHWLLKDGRGFVPPIIGPHAHTRPATAIGFSLWDRKGGDPAEWPEDLRVREYPK